MMIEDTDNPHSRMALMVISGGIVQEGFPETYSQS